MTQPGSGSTPTRICRPVRSRRACRWSASRSNCSAASACRSPDHGCRHAERQGRDAAARGVVGQQAGEHLGEVDGVGQARRLGPVGVVDAVLDHLVLEAPVGEAVEGHDLEAARVELAAQPVGGGRVPGQGAGDGGAQPQPQRRARSRAEVPAHGQGEAVELADDRLEVLAGVDVGAVGDVDRLPVGMPEAHRSVPRAAQHGVAHEAVGRRRARPAAPPSPGARAARSAP